VETKEFVNSDVNVILSRQTCGQRSSRAVGSKHQALDNCFGERICYMLPISNAEESVHFYCTFEKKSAAQCDQKNVFRPWTKSEFGIARDSERAGA